MIKKLLDVIKKLWVLFGIFMFLNACVLLFYELMIWYSSLFGCPDKENVEFAQWVIRTILSLSLYYNIKLKYNKYKGE